MLGLRSHTVGLSRRNRRHGLAVEEVRPVAVVKHVSGVFPPLVIGPGLRDGIGAAANLGSHTPL
jgi:hypothetical protein